MPFDLFPASHKTLLTSLLGQKPMLAKSAVALSDTELRSKYASEEEYNAAVEHWIDAGVLERGKGGYRIDFKAELVIRLLGVLLYAIGKPGVISSRSVQKADSGS
ncbi:MAG: hypothetical protein K0Q59_4084 [Paenibacillus sp.]|nr:hypothetical protein [Paenibacillus sp.]